MLELGCGHGVISEVLAGAGPAGAGLAGAGVMLFAVDASPTLLAVFRKRFPGVRTECAAAEDSSFFGRRFDGVVAWGLIFLLEEESQRRLIAKMFMLRSKMAMPARPFPLARYIAVSASRSSPPASGAESSLMAMPILALTTTG